MRAILPIILLFITACQDTQTSDSPPPLQQKHQLKHTLNNIILGDGHSLSITLNIQWCIDSTNLFQDQFESPNTYQTQILIPRQREILHTIARKYLQIDLNQLSQKQHFYQQISSALTQQLGETNIAAIENVQVETIAFPNPFYKQIKQYTQKIRSLKEREKLQIQSNTIDFSLIKNSTLKMLNIAEKKLGESLIFSSGYRTVEHNRAVGGVPNSAHLRGYAVDILIYSSNHKKRLIKALRSAGFKRIGIYQDHIHADNDPSLKNATWYN